MLILRAVQRANGEDAGVTLRELTFHERLRAAGAGNIGTATAEQLEKAFDEA